MRSTRSASTHERPSPGGARGVAALALFAAAGIHGAQAARHLPEGSLHGRLHTAFFFGAAAFQLVAAIDLIFRRRSSIVAAANLALAAVWCVAVTIGLPDWLAPASPEPVTLAGAASAGLEVVAASVLIASVLVPTRRAGEEAAKPRGIHTGRAMVPAALALVAVGWAVPVPAESHHHATPTASSDHAASHSHDDGHHSGEAASSDHHDASHSDHHAVAGLEDVHLHGLGGDPADAGPDPLRQAQGSLAGTRVPIGGHPAAIAVAENTVWVADREAGFVQRLDASTGRTLGAATRVGVHPGGIAVGEGAVWVTNAGSNTVSRLDPATGEHLGDIPVGKVPVGVAVGAGLVWVANSAEGTVSRIDITTGDVVTTPRIGYGPTAITVVAGTPWVVASLDRAVLSLDPDTGTVVTQTAVDGGATAIAFGHGSVWVASSSAGTVSRIDAATGARIGAPIVVDLQAQPGQGPTALAIGDRVWVLNNHDKALVAIDPSTHGVSQPEFIDRVVAPNITPASIAITAGGELWATDHDSGHVVRFQPRKDTQ